MLFVNTSVIGKFPNNNNFLRLFKKQMFYLKRWFVPGPPKRKTGCCSLHLCSWLPGPCPYKKKICSPAEGVSRPVWMVQNRFLSSGRKDLSWARSLALIPAQATPRSAQRWGLMECFWGGGRGRWYFEPVSLEEDEDYDMLFVEVSPTGRKDRRKILIAYCEGWLSPWVWSRVWQKVFCVFAHRRIGVTEGRDDPPNRKQSTW